MGASLLAVAKPIYYIHFSNKNGMVILSVVCTQCIIQSKISAFPGPYSTLKCPLCRSLLLNSTKLCMQLLASRVQDILQPLQIYHSKPFALVWWPNVIIVKYVRFCEERIKNREKQKNIGDKNRKKRYKIILSKKLFDNRYLKREKGKKKKKNWVISTKAKL